MTMHSLRLVGCVLALFVAHSCQVLSGYRSLQQSSLNAKEREFYESACIIFRPYRVMALGILEQQSYNAELTHLVEEVDGFLLKLYADQQYSVIEIFSVNDDGIPLCSAILACKSGTSGLSRVSGICLGSVFTLGRTHSEPSVALYHELWSTFKNSEFDLQLFSVSAKSRLRCYLLTEHEGGTCQAIAIVHLDRVSLDVLSADVIGRHNEFALLCAAIDEDVQLLSE